MWVLGPYNITSPLTFSTFASDLCQVGFDKERLAEESANPVLLVSETDRPGTAPAKHLKPDMVRLRPLPLYRDVNFTNHEAVQSSMYTDFDELGPTHGKVREGESLPYLCRMVDNYGHKR